MKIPSADNPQEPDDFLLLMSYCFEHGVSINANPMSHRLAIMGTDNPETVGWIISHYEQAAHWLPGICDGCERWCLTRTEAYWGAHPHFCNRCLAWTIRYFEENGKWPEGNWFPGEKFELDEPELLDEEEPDEEI